MSFHATLVIMAAGMGSRFGGLKQAEPVGKNGEAIVDYSVYDALEAGFDKVVFVIKHAIEDDFKRLVGDRISKKVKVEYAFQEMNDLPSGYVCPETRQKPWGTGQAILACRNIVKEPFAVINADDYYGKTAFKVMFEELKKQNEGEYCMVGFHLINTLTDNGTVSRGICEQKDGYLVDVNEVTKLQDCKSFDDEGNVIGQYAPDTLVSMNMWGLTPDIFDYLEEDFKKFLDENINEPKKEFYIPLEIDTLIKRGIKKVRVLSSADRWYGVTYREDKQGVVDAIAEMTAKGMYD
ncbi:MAG: sugar phosphate nucleotidyltransferase [Acutalibacteraceae bacterium]|nr:sugar phosphate nucleotidyltransferase [Acutalibacteraceae bacterium]